MWIRTENENQASFSPFGPHEISVLAELTWGLLCCHLTDVPPQPNSPPDCVFREWHWEQWYFTFFFSSFVFSLWTPSTGLWFGLLFCQDVQPKHDRKKEGKTSRWENCTLPFSVPLKNRYFWSFFALGGQVLERGVFVLNYPLALGLLCSNLSPCSCRPAQKKSSGHISTKMLPRLGLQSFFLPHQGRTGSKSQGTV